MQSIFPLEVIYYNGKLKYPKKTSKLFLGFFSSVENAEQFLENLPDNPDFNFLYNVIEEKVTLKYNIYFFRLFEYRLDGDNKIYSTRIYKSETNHCNAKHLYESNLNPKNTVFEGRDESDCKFRRGDFVEFYNHGTINIGIIAAMPLTKDFIQSLKEKEGEETINLPDQRDDSYRILVGKKKFHRLNCRVYYAFHPGRKIKHKIGEKLQQRLLSEE